MHFRKIYSIVLLLLVICASSVQAQRIFMGVNAGYASFSATDLQRFQRVTVASAPVPAKIVQSFPGYINYSIDYAWVRDSVFFGLLVGHTSTGGRIAYSDYSGSYIDDQVLSMTYYGIQAGRRIAKSNHYQWFLGVQLIDSFVSFKVNHEEVIFDERFSSQRNFKSSSLAAIPHVEVRRFWERFIARIRAGYQVDIIPAKIDISGQGSTSQTFKANASGLRLTGGVAYVLK